MERNDLNQIQRAYALVTKAALEHVNDGVYVRGVATTPTPDRYGDVVKPMGAKFALPLPLLWQHNAQKPLGNVVEAHATEEGIPFKAFMPKPTKSSALIERYDEAVESVEKGLVRGVSIGFRTWEGGYDFNRETGAVTFNAWEWLENSLVTIPANPDGTVRSVTIAEVKQYALAGIPANAKGPVQLTADDLRRHARKQGAVYLK